MIGPLFDERVREKERVSAYVCVCLREKDDSLVCAHNCMVRQVCVA